MKKALLFPLSCVVALLFSLPLQAQIPSGISYQAVARDAAGKLRSNETVTMRFSILDSSPLGPVVYQEVHSVSTNELGLFSLQLMGGTPTATYPPVNWKGATKFLRVEIADASLGSFIDLGTQPFLAVPYALATTPDDTKIDVVAGAVAGHVPILSATGYLSDSNVAVDELLRKTNTTPYTPSGDYNPATKKYVDDVANPIGRSTVPNGTAIGQTLHWDGAAWVADSGIVSTGKRLGIGVQQPESPLGISTESSGDGSLMAFSSAGSPPVMGTRLLSDASGNGLSIDDRNVLGLRSLFAIRSGSSSVGINEALPHATLHVTRHVGDADAPIDLVRDGKLIMFGGSTDKHLVFDYQGIQARQGSSGLMCTTTHLRLQPLGGGLTINNDLSANEQVSITSSGKMGLGVLVPAEKLAMSDSTESSPVAISFENRAAASSSSWAIGQGGLQTDTRRNGCLSFYDPKSSTWDAGERAVILSNGYVGINEKTPDTYLHVAAPPSTSLPPMTLSKTTALTIIGRTSEENLAIDGQRIQARSGRDGYVDCTTTHLNVQPLGGDVIFHGETDGNQQSRMFIVKDNGKVGVGTVTPTEKLSVSDSVNNGLSGVSLSNAAVTKNAGWVAGHINDNSISERNGAFSIFESTSGSSSGERLTILAGGYVGVNEKTPDTYLHVSAPPSSSLPPMTLSKTTALTIIGRTTEENLAIDGQRIQARTGRGGFIDCTTTHLNVQPLGGDVIFHGETDGNQQSRMFIVKDNGKVGVGTVTPNEKLSVSDSVNNGITGLSLSNAAVTKNAGWKLGHVNDNNVSERNGAFSIWESVSGGSMSIERITILPSGQTGINEELPHTTLQVSKPVSTVEPVIGMEDSAALVLFGNTNEEHLAFNGRSLQARSGRDKVVVCHSTAMVLQPHGGGLVVHGDDDLASRIFVIKGDGMVGMGTNTPESKLHIIAKDTAQDVGIGFQLSNEMVPSTLSTTRIGMKLSCNGTWSTNPEAKNIGLFVSSTGSSNANSNLAAVLNGNVVIGGIGSGTKQVGEGGSNVLVIQDGTAPVESSMGPQQGGIQLFSEANSMGNSIFSLKNGDGHKIQLFRGAALTTEVTDVVDSSYGSSEAAVIDNLRTRINELEARLKSLGLLE